jgi:hypothetical protein
LRHCRLQTKYAAQEEYYFFHMLLFLFVQKYEKLPYNPPKNQKDAFIMRRKRTVSYFLTDNRIVFYGNMIRFGSKFGNNDAFEIGP